jgi:hypothetical protein
MALKAAERFALIAEALGRAEEQASVDLAEFAAEHALTLAQVKDVLEPVLYLEFRDSVGQLVDGSGAYLVTEDDQLVVSDGHWLGAARSTPPSPGHAVRLMIAGMIAKSVLPATIGLDEALAKLAAVVDAAIVIEASRPRFTELCEQALASRRTLRFSYFSESNARRGDHEIEPGFVGSNWGRWYLIGHAVDGSGRRTFRIDRIIDGEVTETPCVPDLTITLPDWWDLDEYRRNVRLRLPRRALDRIPTPAQIDIVSEEADDIVVADVGVIGDHRFMDLLVMLGTEAEIIDRADAEQIRREQAARILALYL